MTRWKQLEFNFKTKEDETIDCLLGVCGVYSSVLEHCTLVSPEQVESIRTMIRHSLYQYKKEILKGS